MPSFFIDDYNSISIENGEALKEEEIQVVRGRERFDFHFSRGLIRLKLPLEHCSNIQVCVGDQV